MTIASKRAELGVITTRHLMFAAADTVLITVSGPGPTVIRKCRRFVLDDDRTATSVVSNQ
jgi:hypothetical protein